MKIEYERVTNVTQSVIEATAYGHASSVMNKVRFTDVKMYKQLHTIIQAAFIRGYQYGSGELEIKVAKVNDVDIAAKL